jgi:hypothetical protein|tara:strand:+ start:530 stop:724 length:195 start_codon:yes stop_codon:yes gene_type:complete
MADTVNPLALKRQTYLTMFKDGVADGLLNGNVDDDKRWSAYYKQGYDFGITLYGRTLEVESVDG